MLVETYYVSDEVLGIKPWKTEEFCSLELPFQQREAGGTFSSEPRNPQD